MEYVVRMDPRKAGQDVARGSTMNGWLLSERKGKVTYLTVSTTQFERLCETVIDIQDSAIHSCLLDGLACKIEIVLDQDRQDALDQRLREIGLVPIRT